MYQFILYQRLNQSVIFFCFLFLIIMSGSFSVTTSNDSFISASPHCLVKHVIRSSNCSASEIDFIAKESSMVTSSSSPSISFRCSWSLWHPITVSMAFWQDSCCQAVFEINRRLWCYHLLIKIDVFCGRNISWKLFNQAFKFLFFSKISQLNIGLTFLKPTLLKTVDYCFLRDFIPSRFYLRGCF